MNIPKISVIVPVYRVEEYLESCIHSILGQSFTDFEVILIDDGSPDRSGAICDEFARRDDRVIVVHKENEGVSIARNTGIEIARGEYITFVDSDDMLDENFLSEAISEIHKFSADMYISGLVMEMWTNGAISNTVKYGVGLSRSYSVKELLEDMDITYPQICICGPWCKLYKRTMIMEFGIRFSEQLDYGEDTCFNLDVLERCDSVYFSQSCFYHYRRMNENSLFSKFHRDTYEVHQFVYSKMRNLMERCECEKSAMQRFEGVYFSLLVGGIHEYYRHSNRTSKSGRLAQIIKVAKDPDVKRTRFENIGGMRNKVIFALMKLRMFYLVMLAFEARYYSRKKQR